MEDLSFPIAAALTGAVLLRLLIRPLRFCLRLFMKTGVGLLCMMALEAIASAAGISIPFAVPAGLVTTLRGFPGVLVAVLLTLLR